MHKTIENTIKKNLPENKHSMIKRMYDNGFDEALSQINTSLIADEVLKVMVEKIESYKKIELLKLRSCENDKINWNYHQGKVHQLEDLLSNLSTNKENKNNEKEYN